MWKVEPPCMETLRQVYLEEERTLREMADTYGVSPGTVRRWLVGAGIGRRPTGYRRRPAGEEVKRLYEQPEWTLARVAEEYGVSVSTVVRWLRAYEIETRGAE